MVTQRGYRSKSKPGRVLVKHVDFNDIADFDVLKIFNYDPAFIPLLDLPHIIFEPPKRPDFAFVDCHKVSKNPDTFT